MVEDLPSTLTGMRDLSAARDGLDWSLSRLLRLDGIRPPSPPRLQRPAQRLRRRGGPSDRIEQRAPGRPVPGLLQGRKVALHVWHAHLARFNATGGKMKGAGL